MLKLNRNGAIQWQKQFGGNRHDQLNVIQQDQDGNYILGGFSQSPVSGNKTQDTIGHFDYWLVKVKNPFYVGGNIFLDLNNDCVQNSPNEKGAENYSIKISKDNYSAYTSSYVNGFYLFQVPDTGTYQIELQPNGGYRYFSPAACNVYTTHVEDSVLIKNFAINTPLLCINNTVDVSTSDDFRRCIKNKYYVTFCNHGSIPSTGTYIDISLDHLLNLDNASAPFTSLGNNVYRFQVGTLDIFQCGIFTLDVTPRCDSTIEGQTLCVEAHIYPDTVCTSPNYNGSHIVASAACLGDSVKLELKNIGSDMQQQKKYIVIEGNVMRSIRNYQLPSNTSLSEILSAAGGKTYRIRAEQETNFQDLWNDFYASVAIEGCRTNPALNFATGFFSQFSNFDGEPYRSLSCKVLVSNYAPEQKAAYPIGYDVQHYIEPNTSLDYQINFQNTGHDTAHEIIIVDTISPFLDINSIQLSSASHSYRFERVDSNVVRFVFTNINLADSFTNATLSSGFVKFSIYQKRDVAVNTIIYNSAVIYFGDHSPVITNQTFHTIAIDYILVDLTSVVTNTAYNIKSVKVFPNPFRDKTKLIVEGEQLKDPVLLLMNMEGRIIKTIHSSIQNTFELNRQDINSGTFIYKIMENDQVVSTGKLIAQ